MKGAVKSSRGRREADESCRVLARSVIMIEAAVGCISADRSSASCTVLWLNPYSLASPGCFASCRGLQNLFASVVPGNQERSPGIIGLRFGTEWSEVQVLSPRPILSATCETSLHPIFFDPPNYLTKNATPAAGPSWVEVTHFWHMGLVPWPLFVVGQPRERIQLRRIFAETGDGLLSRQVLRIPWAPEAVRVEIKPSLNSSPVHLFGGTVPPPSSSKGGAHHGTCCTDREV